MDVSRVKSPGKFLMTCILLWLRTPLPTLFKNFLRTPHSFLVMPLEKQECTRTTMVEKIFCAVLKVKATKTSFSYSHVSIFAKISQFSTMGTWDKKK